MEKDFDELVRMKQAGEIGMKNFVLMSEYADDYRDWLSDRDESATDDNAQTFFDELDKEFEYTQNENLEGDYGV